MKPLIAAPAGISGARGAQLRTTATTCLRESHSPGPPQGAIDWYATSWGTEATNRQSLNSDTTKDDGNLSADCLPIPDNFYLSGRGRTKAPQGPKTVTDTEMVKLVGQVLQEKGAKTTTTSKGRKQPPKKPKAKPKVSPEPNPTAQLRAQAYARIWRGFYGTYGISPWGPTSFRFET